MPASYLFLRFLLRSARDIATGCMLCLVVGTAVAASGSTELQERTVLLVCTAPDNLPYSNRAGEGFENKIAELVAADLGITLTYVWFPQSLGNRFLRETLNARRCDLVIGISVAHELLLNTNPYYSSAFVLLYRADADFELTSLSGKALKEHELRIGLVGGTPATELLLGNDLITQVVPYRPVVTTNAELPSELIFKDMLNGKLDVALLWGPVAGWLNQRHGSRFKLVPLVSDHSNEHPLVFQITMGVRRGEIQWKRKLNKVLRRNKDKIAAILTAYGVPLVKK